MYSRSELGSNVDTMFVGANFCILQHTTIYFDVSPYCDKYESIKGATLVHETNFWKSPETGKTYSVTIK